MVKYRWSVEFVLPGVPLERPVQIGNMVLRPAPIDDNGGSRSTGSLLLEIEKCPDEDAAAARAMQELEAVTISAAAIGGSVRAPVVTSIHLENEAELEAAGLRTPIKGGKILHTWDVIAPIIDGSKLAKGYQAAVGLSADWHRAARWLWKANSETDPYDHLLALWISFSVLYGRQMINGESEQSAIKRYVDATFTSSAVSLLLGIDRENLRRLGDKRLTLRAGRGKPALQIGEDLGKALSQPPSLEVVKLTLLSIYAVRNGIVHRGSAVSNRDDEIRLRWASAHVLKEVIMHVLRDELGL